MVVVPVVHPREGQAHAAEDESTAAGATTEFSDADSTKALTYTLRNLHGFSEYIVELQTCQVRLTLA
ncbi:unnamed protein product [Dibothriocephalus latus]|uniref:Uncharacterized protein n=1 Tax=Dibothriocephalus latus TaxID=60516 RepID=A0A3P7PCB9_DIBLA|nr:unnamed protein product [Dibothriocephalus latus]